LAVHLFHHVELDWAITTVTKRYGSKCLSMQMTGWGWRCRCPLIQPLSSLLVNQF